MCSLFPCVCIMHMVSELKTRVMLTLFIHPLRFRVGGPRRPHGDSGDGAPWCCCVHRGRGQETGAAEAQSQTKGILPSIFWIQTHSHTAVISLPKQLCQITSTKGCGNVSFLFSIQGMWCFFCNFRTSRLQDVVFCICVALCLGFLWLYLSCTLTIWYFDVLWALNLKWSSVWLLVCWGFSVIRLVSQLFSILKFCFRTAELLVSQSETHLPSSALCRNDFPWSSFIVPSICIIVQLSVMLFT